jgi:hypothetical protein
MTKKHARFCQFSSFSIDKTQVGLMNLRLLRGSSYVQFMFNFPGEASRELELASPERPVDYGQVNVFGLS